MVHPVLWCCPKPQTVYILCDSYTSNFQKVIYDVDQVTEFQLMQGMNLCACAISGTLAVLHGQFFSGIAFCLSHPLWYATVKGL